MKTAFNKLQASFQIESRRVVNRHVAVANEVSNQRGRTVSKFIPVSEGKSAQNLARLAKFGRIAGPAMIALDGGLRYRKVKNMREQGDVKWKREAVAQSAGFAAGIASGAMLVGAMTLVITLAPAGIVLGVVAAGLTAVGMDYTVQFATKKIYDLF